MAAWPPASGSGFSCYFSIRLFIREVIKTSYIHGHVGGIDKVTRSLSLNLSVSATKTQFEASVI